MLTPRVSKDGVHREVGLGMEIKALLDTGASREFMSVATFNRLVERGATPRLATTTVRHLSGQCTPKHELELMLELPPSSGTRRVMIPLTALVVDGLDEDFILGLPTMQSAGLMHLLTAPAESDAVVEDADALSEEEDAAHDGTLPTVGDIGAEEVGGVVREFSEVFGPLPLDGALVEPMRIDLVPGLFPRSMPPRRLSPAMSAVVAEEVDSWLQTGVIQPSTSCVVAPVVLVRKKDGDYRVCVDYRELNRCTKDVKFPIECVRAVLSRLANHAVFGTIDLRSGFHQIPLEEGSQHLTAFAIPGGLFEFRRVQFGLKNGPAVFQMTMLEVLSGLVGRICEVFIDDIVVYADDGPSFAANLRAVLSRLRERRLRVKGSKCVLGLPSIDYLGHVVSAGGIRLSESRKQGLRDVKAPASVSQLRSFLGMATFFRPFIFNFATLAKPLHAMCTPKVPFSWTPEAQESFDRLKDAVMESPMLHFLDYSKPIIIRTDASQLGVGGILLQVEDAVEKPVSYVSRAFTAQEGRWSTIEQEAYGIYFAITSMDHFIKGHPFIVQTDHRNLVYLYKATAPKVVRWRLRLQEYQFEVHHIPGRMNVVADGLSRCLAGRDMPHGEDIMSVHNAVLGHRGVDLTVDLLRAAGREWSSMRADVAAFIHSCPTCQKVRLGQGSMAAAVRTTAVREPFDTIAVDTMGPFPADAYGNQFVIVMMDCFTRFVELRAAPDNTAFEAARALLDIFGRYGAPRELRSDQGSQYTARVVDNLLHLVGAGRDFTIPHRPQSNGIVERECKEVGRHLRALLMDQRCAETWSITLPIVQRIINSTPHLSTGCAPVRLLFGDAVSLDRQLLKEPEEGTPQQINYEDYVCQLTEKQKELLDKSREHQDRVVEEYVAQSPETPTSFEVGQYVLVSYPDRPPSKLVPRWQGPVVISGKNGVQYDVQDLSTKGVRSVHVTRLKRYDMAQTDDPLMVAAADGQEYVVEDIVGHRAAQTREGWRFRVRWRGYSAESDSWLPYDQVRDVAAFRAYRLAHPELRL